MPEHIVKLEPCGHTLHGTRLSRVTFDSHRTQVMYHKAAEWYANRDYNPRHLPTIRVDVEYLGRMENTHTGYDADNFPIVRFVCDEIAIFRSHYKKRLKTWHKA